jgi:uncharacterized protein (UPF0297 family)
MITLTNGCSCIELSVHPTNWNASKFSVKKDWYIFYRFYDPVYKEKYPNGLLRIIKGMNKYKDITNRQKAVKDILDNELDVLKNDGYNPISQKFNPPVDYEISATTPVARALKLALQRKECEPRNNIRKRSRNFDSSFYANKL